jgi:addiction module HigA family antidote
MFLKDDLFLEYPGLIKYSVQLNINHQQKRFMIKNKLPNIHPGEILHEEFIIPLNITPYRVAKETNIPQTRISEIIKGNRRITADTALRLSQFFGNSAKF